MPSFWARYVAFLERHCIAILVAAAVLTGIGAFLGSRLQLLTDFSELLPKKAPSVIELERISKRLGGASNLVVGIEGGDWKKREAFAEKVVAHLKKRVPPSRINFIDYKVGEARAFYEKNKFLYVDLEDLKEVKRRIKAKIADEEARAIGVVDLVGDDDGPKKPATIDVDDIKKKYEARVADYDHFPDGYFITPDRTMQALLVRIPSSALGEASADVIIEEVRHVIDELEPAKEGYKILIGGDPVAAQDERNGVVEDLVVVSTTSIGLVVLAMMMYYRSRRALLLLAAPVLLGAALAFGIARLAIGSLNSNTAFLGSIIVGNGINFGIILLARILEERRGGSSAREGLVVALSSTWSGTATAALAASISYGSLMVTDFRGFSQFGFIGGIGMILCWLATFTVMPALAVALERRWPVRVGKLRPATDQVPDLIAGWVRRWHVPVALGGIAVTAIAAVAAAHFYRDPFEYDFRKLRSKRASTTGASALGRRVDKIFAGTAMMAGTPTVMLIDRPEQLQPLLATIADAKKKGAHIDRAESIYSVMPKDQPEKIQVLREIGELLDKKVMGWLSKAQQAELEPYKPPPDLRPVTVDELPEILLRPFIERDGRRGLVVFIFPPPGTDYMDGKLLLKFADSVRELRLPDGEVLRTSGHEVVLADILRAILRDGPKTTLASFLGVVFLVMLSFKLWRDRMLVLLSLIVGVIWMCGAAALFGIKVNMLNFVALPITFGIGAEYPVNFLRRYISDGRSHLGRAILRTGSAVALCSLTTTIGYGSLLIADTRALNSFGLLAVLGEVMTLAAAVLWMPSVLEWLEKRRS